MSYPPPSSNPPGGYGAQPPGGYGAPPPGGYGAPPGGYGGPVKQTNGLAIASLVLGVLALVTCGWLGFLGLISIPLGIAGLSKAKKLNGSGKGLAIGGIVTGLLGIVAIVLWAALVWFAADNVDDFDFYCDSNGNSRNTGKPCESQGNTDPDPNNFNDPEDGICNKDRYLEDPDC